MKTQKHIALNNSDVVIPTTFKKETDKAILVEAWNVKYNTFFDAWIPKSLITISEEAATVPQWFFAKTFGKFLVGFETRTN